MAETLTIRTAASTEVIKIAVQGPQGPAGAPGTGLETLTTQGDTLYRGASTGERLPIGAAGQVLKVVNGLPAWANESGAVSSVAGRIGTVTLVSVDIGSEQVIEVSEAGDANCNGVFVYGGDFNGRPTYYKDKDTFVYWDNVWNISHNADDKYVGTNTSRPWQSVWSLGSATGNLPVVEQLNGQEYEKAVGQRTNPTAFGTASVKNVGTGANDVAAGNHTHSDATASVAGFLSAADKTKLDGIASGATANTASSATPQALGVAAAGTSTDFARADHVHAMPSAADVGAAPATGIDPTAITGTAVVDSDARLSDSRTPTSHAASHHASAGSDPLFDQDLNTTDSPTFGVVTVNEMYAEQFVADGALNDPPTSDVVDFTAQGISFQGTAAATTRTNLGLGTAATADIGTGAGEVAEGNHTHTQLHDRSHAITSTSDHTAGNHKVFYSDGSGNVQELALGASGEVLTSNGASAAPSFAAASGGDTVTINASAADVLSVASGEISAVDATADKIVFWDDSASELTYLALGSGLSITDQTISATASGGSKTYAVFSAEHNQPPSTAFATLDTRNSIAVLDFDDATDESAVFVSIIPEGASLGSGLKIRLHWMATTATSGNVVWDVSLERMTTDLDSDSFDTIASGTAAANGTSGILTVTEITLTTIDSVTAGDGFRLKVTRDANNASDTMTGDAELVVCEVRSAA